MNLPVNPEDQNFKMTQQKDAITSLIQGEWDQDLSCPICLNLIIGPRECGTCQNLACDECII